MIFCIHIGYFLDLQNFGFFCTSGSYKKTSGGIIFGPEEITGFATRVRPEWGTTSPQRKKWFLGWSSGRENTNTDANIAREKSLPLIQHISPQVCLHSLAMGLISETRPNLPNARNIPPKHWLFLASKYLCIIFFVFFSRMHLTYTSLVCTSFGSLVVPYVLLSLLVLHLF